MLEIHDRPGAITGPVHIVRLVPWPEGDWLAAYEVAVDNMESPMVVHEDCGRAVELPEQGSQATNTMSQLWHACAAHAKNCPQADA